MERERPRIVCLCGSTRFYRAFREANLRETLAGKIVLSIGVDFKSDADMLLAGELTLADKERLDELHLRKIDLCDEILVLNVDGYVGESTSREICYAERHGKHVRWLESTKVDVFEVAPDQGACSHCARPTQWLRYTIGVSGGVTGRCDTHAWVSSNEKGRNGDV